MCISTNVGDICVLEETIDIFKRVQIKCVRNDRNCSTDVKLVDVRCIDSGIIHECIDVRHHYFIIFILVVVVVIIVVIVVIVMRADGTISLDLKWCPSVTLAKDYKLKKIFPHIYGMCRLELAIYYLRRSHTELHDIRRQFLYYVRIKHFLLTT